jgi:hypothetical protein
MAMEQLEYVAAVMTMLSVVPYIRDTVRGVTAPQRTSWFVFAGVAAVAAAGQLSDGPTAGGFLALGSAVGFTGVALASVKHGEGGTDRGDMAAMVMLLIGVALWALTDEPLIAVVAAVAVDFPAAVLTLRKAIRNPHSETLSSWVIDGVAGIVTIVAVGEMQIALVLYPVYHVISNSTIAFAVASGRRAPVAA